MSRQGDAMDSRHERIWEHLDMLAAAGVTVFSVTGLWRSLPSRGPGEFGDCTRVLNCAVAGGLMTHPERGVFLIAGATQRVELPKCRHGKTGEHRGSGYYCAGPSGRITAEMLPSGQFQ